MTLRYRGFEFLDFEGYHFVMLTHFRLVADTDSAALLAELIETDAYNFGYGSDFVSPPVATAYRAIHGCWWRDSITVERFQPISPAAAHQVLAEWAARSSKSRLAPHVLARLGSLHDLLSRGDVFNLNNPPDESRHDWGYVVGVMGFHEFVVVDRTARHLTLIVASDD